MSLEARTARQRAAKQRREVARAGPFSVLTMEVECELSEDGPHEVSVRFAHSGHLAGLRCTCGALHQGAGLAMYHLGAEGTCGHALGAVRKYVLGHGGGDIESELTQLFGAHVIEALKVPRLISQARRASNRTFRPSTERDFKRGGEEILSRLFAERMGFTGEWFAEVKPDFSVACDREGRPRRALIAGQLVAKRGRAGWVLRQQGISATMGKVVFEHHGCPVCASRGKGPKGASIGFSNTGRLNAHAGSKAHRDVYEFAVFEVLDSLPGVGSTEDA